ncbi:MAG: alginate lyase family protein [Nitrososphaeraceae archaeon]
MPKQAKAIGPDSLEVSHSMSSARPRTIIFEPLLLINTKKAIMNNDNPTLKVALQVLTSQADSFLMKEPASVIEKNESPPSGDKHDFLSLAPYRWPDPTKKDGLPYVGRDGMINPEIYSIPDLKNMGDMISTVHTLSAAYFLTDNPKYASKAAELLRVWFLNNNTRMNPNLKYAELVRGIDKSYPAGIMDGRNLTDVIDAVGLIQRSTTWTKEDQSGMKTWFSKYLNWLLNSRVGKEESQKINNHGTYYNLQVAAIALFTYKPEIAKDIIQSLVQKPSISTFSNPEKSLAVKIQPDGHQPFELQRSDSLDYSMFNLYGLFKLADIGNRLGIDVWSYGSPDKPLLQKALDYLLPYIMKPQEWPYLQVTPINRHVIAADLLCHAITHYPRNESLYVQVYTSLVSDRTFFDAHNLPCMAL